MASDSPVINVQIKDIYKWGPTQVKQFFQKNKISGCDSAIEKYNVDGKVLLGLDKSSLQYWDISFVQKAKIHALLNTRIGPEDYRKKLFPHQRTNGENPLKKEAENNINTPVLFEADNTKNSVCSSTKAKTNGNGYHPPLPFKPSHLRPENMSYENIKEDIRRLPSTRNELDAESYLVPREQTDGASSYNNSRTTDQEAELYEYVDEFSSDEFTSEEEVEKIQSTQLSHQQPQRMVRTIPMQSVTVDGKETSVTVSFGVTIQNQPSSSKGKNIKHKMLDWPTGRKMDVESTVPIPSPPLLPAPRSGSSSQHSSHLSLSRDFLGRPLPSAPPKEASTYSLKSNSGGTLSKSFLNNLSSALKSPTQLGSSFKLNPQKSDSSHQRSVAPSTDDAGSMPWFFNIGRQEAENCLRNLSDGTFVIRPSTHAGPNNPLTLSLQYKGRVFHISIRQRSDSKLALGTKKKGEAAFYSIASLVNFYRTEHFKLQTGNGSAGTTCLRQWPDFIK